MLKKKKKDDSIKGSNKKKKEDKEFAKFQEEVQQGPTLQEYYKNNKIKYFQDKESPLKIENKTIEHLESIVKKDTEKVTLIKTKELMKMMEGDKNPKKEKGKKEKGEYFHSSMDPDKAKLLNYHFPPSEREKNYKYKKKEEWNNNYQENFEKKKETEDGSYQQNTQQDYTKNESNEGYYENHDYYKKRNWENDDYNNNYNKGYYSNYDYIEKTNDIAKPDAKGKIKKIDVSDVMSFPTLS